MDTSSRLKSSPPPDPQPRGGDQRDLAQLDSDIVDLNRQITAAVVMELATGGLSDELVAIIHARDLLRARLSSLEGATIG